jgi:hypothetical protein
VAMTQYSNCQNIQDLLIVKTKLQENFSMFLKPKWRKLWADNYFYFIEPLEELNHALAIGISLLY